MPKIFPWKNKVSSLRNISLYIISFENCENVESTRYKYLFLDEQQFNEMENRTFWRFLRGTPLSSNFDKCLHGVPSWFGRILIRSIVRLLYNEFQWRFTITFEGCGIYLIISLKYGTRAKRHIYFQSYHTC